MLPDRSAPDFVKLRQPGDEIFPFLCLRMFRRRRFCLKRIKKTGSCPFQVIIFQLSDKL
jgi:hypothetical protein